MYSTLGQLEIANTIISDLQDAIVVRAWVENGSWGNSIDYRNCGKSRGCGPQALFIL